MSFSGCINIELKGEIKVLSRTAPLTGMAAFLLMKRANEDQISVHLEIT